MASLIPLACRKSHASRWLHVKLSVLSAMIILFAAFFSLYAATVHFSTNGRKGSSSTFQELMPRVTTPMTASLTRDSSNHLSGNTTSLRQQSYHHFTTKSSLSSSSSAAAATTKNDDDIEEEEQMCDVSIFASRIPLADRCKYVRTHEDCQNNIFLQMLYCSPLAHPTVSWIWFIFCGACLLFFFYILGDTADAYFSPSLFTMSEYLKLSPNVAGVTLLALGNGAPDLSAVMVGVFRGNADVGVGTPVGAGMFVSCFVFGCVTLLSTVKVTRRPFLRDVLFYLIAVLFTFYLYVDRKIEIWESIMCLLIYVGYVCAVIIGRAVNQRLKRARMARKEKKLFEEEERKRIAKEKRRNRRLEEKRNANIVESGEQGGVFDEEDNNGGDNGDENFGRVISDEDVELTNVNESDSDSEDDGDWTSGWHRQPSFIQYDREAETNQEESLEKKMRRYQSAVFVPRFGIVSRPKRRNTTTKAASLVIRDYFDNQSIDEEQQRHRVLERQDTTVLVHKDGQTIDSSDIDIDYVKAPEPEAEYYTRQFDEGGNEDMYDDSEKKSKARTLFDLFIESIEWHERAWYQKITFVLFEGVCTFVRNLTIPKGHRSQWNKWFAASVPIFSPIMILFAFNSLFYLIGGVFPLVLIPMAIGTVLAFAILMTSRRKRPPIYYPIFVFYAFFMSIVWIFVVADYLVSLLEAVGIALGINPGVLVLTFLAWGNSVGDLVADVSIARQGFPSMAVGACFGGPLLSLMVGIGASMTAKILFMEPGAHDIQFRCTSIIPEPSVMIIFLCLLVTLIMSMLVVPISRFRSPKPYGVVLILMYGISVLIAVIASLWPGFGNLMVWNIGRGCRESIF